MNAAVRSAVLKDEVLRLQKLLGGDLYAFILDFAPLSFPEHEESLTDESGALLADDAILKRLSGLGIALLLQGADELDEPYKQALDKKLYKICPNPPACDIKISPAKLESLIAAASTFGE